MIGLDMSLIAALAVRQPTMEILHIVNFGDKLSNSRKAGAGVVLCIRYILVGLSSSSLFSFDFIFPSAETFWSSFCQEYGVSLERHRRPGDIYVHQAGHQVPVPARRRRCAED